MSKKKKKNPGRITKGKKSRKGRKSKRDVSKTFGKSRNWGVYLSDWGIKVKFGVVVFPGSNCDEEGKLRDETNPNGSKEFIAGICNKEGNILGMMPHPERAAEALLGSEDGKRILNQ